MGFDVLVVRTRIGLLIVVILASASDLVLLPTTGLPGPLALALPVQREGASLSDCQ